MAEDKREKLAPSAAAIIWHLKALGEVEYRTQQDFADAVGIDYATLKHGLSILRDKEILDREGKKIWRLKAKE